MHENSFNTIFFLINTCVNFSNTLNFSKSFGAEVEMKPIMMGCMIPTFKVCPIFHIIKSNSHKCCTKLGVDINDSSCQVVDVN